MGAATGRRVHGLTDRSSKPWSSPTSDITSDGTANHRFAVLRNGGDPTDRLPPAPAPIDGLKVGQLPGASAGSHRCEHRPGRPQSQSGPLRTRHTRGHDPYRCEETWPDPAGGGWRTLGQAGKKNKKKSVPTGYAFLHSTIDDHSRVVYSEILETRKE
jgi:hypothetical protein